MPWQPMHMAIFRHLHVALGFLGVRKAVTEATAKANIVVNVLFILRAQSRGGSVQLWALISG